MSDTFLDIRPHTPLFLLPSAVGHAPVLAAGPRESARAPAGIAVVRIDGAFDTPNYAALGALIERYAENDAVRGIVLDVSSPGGTAAGVADLADRIFAIRQRKPTATIVNYDCYSAAYYIATATGVIYVPSGGGVGSIGVVTAHVSTEKALSAAGYEMTLLYAGAHKVDGNSFQTLSLQARESLMNDVTFFYEQFVNSISKYRPALTAEAARKTEAACFLGEKAVAAGLADFVMSPDEAIRHFAARLATAGNLSTGASAAIQQASEGRITRAQFDAMSAHDRAAFFRHGGRMSEPTTVKPAQPAHKNAMTRAAFDALSPVEKRAFCLKGGRIFDTEKTTGKSALC